ncbi:MAG TPA: hypothetical protein VD704_09360 [Gaiellaceae bacterium]|nr:hypothetical protein [Gaiellaceae bacterium]
MHLRTVPLLTAELRVRRARQLVGVLKRQAQKWADAHEQFIDVVKGENGRFQLVVARADASRLGRMSITIGETAYNLRSALDFAVYDVAVLATQADVSRTQFPIEEDPEMFEGRITGKHPRTGRGVTPFLRGVPPTAVEYIRERQPFAGCSWTRDLRDLSNPDKHRHLASLRSNVKVLVKESQIVPNPDDPDKGTLNIRYDAEVEVFLLDGGAPVQEKLEELCGEVGATLALLKRHITSEPPR